MLMAGALAAYLTLNVVQATVSPDAVADRWDSPSRLTASHWVRIYASRTAASAAILVILLIHRHLAELSIVIAIAVVLPVIDATLTWRAGADPAVVARTLRLPPASSSSPGSSAATPVVPESGAGR